MKTTVRLLTVLSVLVISLTFSACGNAASGTPEAKYRIRNSSVVLYENGETSFVNYGKGTDENTVYELASNGKTIAAYTALAMVDEGILNLDEKISPYLDSALLTKDPRMNDFTLRELLSHTAGFSPSYELGVDKKIYTDPGSKFCYSGVGYIYMQSVIENAGQMTMNEAASKYVFKPLGMTNSTFESTRTVTPYMNLSSAVLYAMLIFVVSFIVLLLIFLIVGLISKFRFYKFRTAFLLAFLIAGIINAAFLLFVFVSKVFVVFLACFALMGIVLLLTMKHPKIFYLSVPVLLTVIFVLGFTLPVSIPVTNDLTPKKANCAYTFKSTTADMALFCSALMEKANTGEGVYGEMFLPAVEIDETDAWGLGIAIEHTNNEENTKTTYWHSGINPGFQSLYVLDPEENKYIVVITNSDNGLDYSKEKAREFLRVNGEWNIRRD